VILYDRRNRLKVTYQIGQPIDQAQERYFFGTTDSMEIPLSLYIRMSIVGRTDMLLWDVYMEWGNRKTMPLRHAHALTLPSGGSAGNSWNFHVLMKPLAQELQERGHILSADVWLVAQDGVGLLHRKRILINDMPIWAKGSDPRHAR
jgi:hypothetical protein